MTAEQLAAIFGIHTARAALWAADLSTAMDRFEINTPARQAAFLAQVGHESGRLIYVRELWNPVRCPWQARYEGRADLGNTQPGDGARYMGRGLIQITGRENYREVGAALGEDFENLPERLEQQPWAALSAGWFWHAHGLNAYADVGDFDGVCDLINLGHKTRQVGDANGYADRVALWTSAKEVLQC